MAATPGPCRWGMGRRGAKAAVWLDRLGLLELQVLYLFHLLFSVLPFSLRF